MSKIHTDENGVIWVVYDGNSLRPGVDGKVTGHFHTALDKVLLEEGQRVILREPDEYGNVDWLIPMVIKKAKTIRHYDAEEEIF